MAHYIVHFLVLNSFFHDARFRPFFNLPRKADVTGGVIQLFVVLSGNVGLQQGNCSTRHSYKNTPGSIFRPRRPLFAVFDGWDLRWWAGEGKPYPILGPGPFFQLQCDDAMIWFSQNTFIVDEDLWRSLVDRFRQCKTHFKTMSYLLRIMWSTISKPFQAYFALFNLKKTSLVQNHKNSSVRTWLAGKKANL